jgi:hypothetical protein
MEESVQSTVRLTEPPPPQVHAPTAFVMDPSERRVIPLTASIFWVVNAKVSSPLPSTPSARTRSPSYGRAAEQKKKGWMSTIDSVGLTMEANPTLMSSWRASVIWPHSSFKSHRPSSS